MKAPLDRRRLGRALTELANTGTPELPAAAETPQSGASVARRIGLTGAPGAGKSTLAGRLALNRARRGGRIGVLAIDPTSPKSGGAILGDRIRMDDLEGSEGLFIRSLSSRTATDGLTDNLPELLDLMDSYGFDEVLLETVGVGQAEHAVRTQVDSLVLVLPPDGGDAIQAMKAGIMEIADIYAINKSDMPQAAKMAGEVKRILSLADRSVEEWQPPVLMTSAQDPESIAGLSHQLDRHFDWLQEHGQRDARRILRSRYRLRRWLERRIGAVIDRQPEVFFDKAVEQQAMDVLRTLALS